MLRWNRRFAMLLLVALLVSACQPIFLPVPVGGIGAPGAYSDQPTRNDEAVAEAASVLTSPFQFEIVIELDEPRDIGSGELGMRYVNYFETGEAAGPALIGEVLPDGQNWFLIRLDCVAELNVRGRLRTDDGELIDFYARGFSRVAPAVMQQVFDGELVNPADAFFRGVIFFDTSAARYDWLNHTVLFGIYRYDLSQLHIDAYAMR